MRVLYFLVTCGAVWPAMACSCGSYEPVKACQIYRDTPVIFRGRVIDSNHDPTVGFAQTTLYRFRVLEAFKGLSPGTKEVFIDPASMTSCYREFAPDHDYLIYTGGSGPAPAAATVLRGQPLNSSKKQIPDAWKGLDKVPVYFVGGCSPSRMVEDNDADLKFLRASANVTTQATGWIEGRAVQNFSWPHNFADFVAVADATLTLTFPSGERKKVLSDAAGTFRFAPVPPGTYSISGASPVLGTGQFAEKTFSVSAGGCAVANASFASQSTISGKVLNADGRPAGNVRLELGEIQSNGKVRVIPQTWANSDKNGNYKIPNAPLGRIVLAANLNGAPTREMPFDPVYLPGTQDLSVARVFTVQPGNQLTDVSLRLPKALPFADLYVDVKWPDGSPALDGARAFAEWNGARADFENAPAATNRVKLRLAIGRKYQISVDWMNATPGKFLFVEGDKSKLVDFIRDGQVVELRLKTPPPSGAPESVR